MNESSGNPFKPGFGSPVEPTTPAPFIDSAAGNVDMTAINKQAAETEIVTLKELRRDLDTQLQKLKGMKATRERAHSITKLQEAIMWLGMSLKEINDTRPYPSSYDPSTTKIEPAADGLKL